MAKRDAEMTVGFHILQNHPSGTAFTKLRQEVLGGLVVWELDIGGHCKPSVDEPLTSGPTCAERPTTRLVLSESGEAKRRSSIGFRRKALNGATYFEIDDVSDPAETRGLITNGIRSLPPVTLGRGKNRSFIDTW